MPYALAIKAIDESIGLGAEWISFTGGEPFLVFDELLELVKYTSAAGVLKEVVTNCSWADTNQNALYHLNQLKDAGLDALNLSVDDFHQDKISLDNVKNCFDAAKRLGLKIVLMMTVKHDSKINSETIRRILDDDAIQVIGEKFIHSPSALVIESSFTPLGRGSKIPITELDYGKWTTEGVCKQVLTDIGVKPNGDILPCCSALALRDDAILGNIIKESLSEVICCAWNDQRFTQIRSDGFRHSDKYVNRCHQCYELF